MRRVLLSAIALLSFAAAYYYLTTYFSSRVLLDGIDPKTFAIPDWSAPDLVMGTGFREPSDLAFYGSGRLVAVGDEYGSIYVLDAISGRQLAVIPFAGNGDYEGIAAHKNGLTVLESNGNLWKLAGGLSGSPDSAFQRRASRVDWDLPGSADAEGIWVDSGGTWIACKGQWRSDPLYSRRILWKPRGKSSWKLFASWHPDSASGILVRSSLARIDQRNSISSAGVLQPSAISRSPEGDFWILSAEPPALAILSAEGHWKAYQPIDRGIWPQPEGIAFDDSGNVYVLSEVTDKIYRYPYQKAEGKGNAP